MGWERTSKTGGAEKIGDGEGELEHAWGLWAYPRRPTKESLPFLQGGGQSCELCRGGLYRGHLLQRLTMQYYQAKQVLCSATRQASLPTKNGKPEPKGSFRRIHMRGWSRKAAEGFQKVYSCVQAYEGWKVVLYMFLYQFLDWCLLQHTVKSKAWRDWQQHLCHDIDHQQ